MTDVKHRAVPAVRVAAIDPDLLVSEASLVRQRYRLVMEHEVLIDQGTPHDSADVIDREAVTAWGPARSNAHDQQRAMASSLSRPRETVPRLGPFASNHQKRAGVITMRYFLALGLLITSCVTVIAAPVHHRRQAALHHGHHGSNYAAPDWLGAYAGPRPQVPYNDAPSYNDPSKFGGDEALPIGR